MKISYNWLKTYLNSDLSIEKIASLLTDLGLEVESTSFYESVKGSLEGVVVGKVISCSKHPNADRLKLTKVKVSNNEILQIVCGAPNVKKGQKVPVALVGSKLHTYNGDEIKIKSSKIRGELSNGMICAEDELGLGESHDGILILNNNIPLGTNCSDIFDIYKDHIFDIGLTPNRADAMSHMGVARDLKASLIQNNLSFKWNIPKINSLPSPTKTRIIKVEVNRKDLCSSYFGITLSNVKVAPSPSWIQNFLKSIGISPINNIVDITNFVMHDIGQPLHSFDADKIVGKIIVKNLKENTSFKTLDNSELKLSSEDLMICDEKKPLCLAGIYGGISSGISDTTKNIFLESACFDPTNTRKSAKRHNLNTDASFRFERGIDPEMSEFALKKATLLMIKYAGALVSSNIEKVCQKLNDEIQIFLPFKKITKTLGQSIAKEELTQILNSLEILIENVSEEGINLKIPRYRIDVTRPADVIEEILRVYGYNNIKTSNEVRFSYPEGNFDKEHFLIEHLSNQLVGKGFSEIINNSITNPSYNKLSKITSEKLKSIKILNPLSEELSQLRKTLLYSGLEVISYNLNRQQKNINIFEIGNSYFIKNKKHEEAKSLFIGLVSPKESSNWINNNISPFFYLKGIVNELLNNFNCDKIKYKITNYDFFSEGLTIKIDNIEIGYFGTIKKSITKHFGINENVYGAILNIQDLIKIQIKQNFKVRSISRFPFSQRDFSILLDKEVSFESIVELSRKTEPYILKSVDLFDVYEGKKVPKNMKSYGVRFTFLDQKKTLTDNYIDKVMNKLKKQFENELNAQLR